MLLPRRRAVAFAAALLVLTAPGCTNKKKSQPAPSATAAAVTQTAAPTNAAPSAASSLVPAAPAPSASSTPSLRAAAKPKPKPKPKPTVKARRVDNGHPLTGGKEPLRPVVVVKINNTGPGMPQSGLASADVIYQELVEGGETRLAAVFSTKLPSQVGPIRSTRQTDIELLGQYGRVSLAFSGAARAMLRVVRQSNLVDARWDAVPSAYTELGGRKAPYRVHASVAKIVARKPGALAKDVGFRFGDLRSPSKPAKTVVVDWQFVDNTARYSAATKRWTIYYGNRRQVEVDNLIVQYVGFKNSNARDAAGNPVPVSFTIGSGRVEVFRDGKAVKGVWHRQHMKSRTTMLDGNKRLIHLKRGTTFVMLLPKNRTISVS